MGEAWDADRLAETVRAYRPSLIVMALVRTGVVERLVEGPGTAANIASRCRVDEPVLRRILDAAASLGIVETSSGTYALPGVLADDLRGGAMDGLRHQADGFDKWARIEGVLRSGRTDFPDDLDVTLDPGRNETFILAMHAYAAAPASRLASILPREGADTLLDLGGGPGTFCFALLDAWPGLRAAVADLPITLRVTRRPAEERGLGRRMSTIEADFYRDRDCDLGGPWDLVLLSSVMHAEGEAENRDLLARVRRVTAPGGRIVIREHVLSEDRASPPRAALFDVHMLVSTRRGRCYTLGEITSMLEDAGFREPMPLGAAEDGLVVARA